MTAECTHSFALGLRGSCDFCRILGDDPQNLHQAANLQEYQVPASLQGNVDPFHKQQGRDGVSGLEAKKYPEIRRRSVA